MTDRYRFDVHLHARSPHGQPGPPWQVGDATWPTIARALSREPVWGVSFDDAFTALEQLPRIYAEPDGSFLWSAPLGEPRWVIDGNLYDRGNELAYVSLKGECPLDIFDKLLACFGWPNVPVTFELCRAGVYIDEATFREIARTTGAM